MIDLKVSSVRSLKVGAVPTASQESNKEESDENLSNLSENSRINFDSWGLCSRTIFKLKGFLNQPVLLKKITLSFKASALSLFLTHSKLSAKLIFILNEQKKVGKNQI